MPHRGRVPSATRRLRLYDRVSHRPHVGRQPRAAHLRRLERNHEGADCMVPMSFCLHQLIEQQARRTPERVALVFEELRLTYGELDRRAERLAQHLRQLGIGPDVPVGLFVERSLEMVAGILAILKAGGAYLPMDTSYPEERLAFMLSDANVGVLLTQGSLLEKLPASGAHRVR